MDDFMVLFYGVVAAVENGEVAEVDLTYETEDPEMSIHVTLRRRPWGISNESNGDS